MRVKRGGELIPKDKDATVSSQLAPE